MASSLRLLEAVKSCGAKQILTRAIQSCEVCCTGGSYVLQCRQYAKPAAGGKKLAAGKVGKIGAAAPKVRMEVETDPDKLCNFLCGGNIYKEGSNPPLKPDSEYPDWLWKLSTVREKVPLADLDPDSWRYWKRLHNESKARFRRLDKLAYKYQRF